MELEAQLHLCAQFAEHIHARFRLWRVVTVMDGDPPGGQAIRNVTTVSIMLGSQVACGRGPSSRHGDGFVSMLRAINVVVNLVLNMNQSATLRVYVFQRDHINVPNNLELWFSYCFCNTKDEGVNALEFQCA